MREERHIVHMIAVLQEKQEKYTRRQTAYQIIQAQIDALFWALYENFSNNWIERHEE